MHSSEVDFGEADRIERIEEVEKIRDISKQIALKFGRAKKQMCKTESIEANVVEINNDIGKIKAKVNHSA